MIDVIISSTCGSECGHIQCAIAAITRRGRRAAPAAEHTLATMAAAYTTHSIENDLAGCCRALLRAIVIATIYCFIRDFTGLLRNIFCRNNGVRWFQLKWLNTHMRQWILITRGSKECASIKTCRFILCWIAKFIPMYCSFPNYVQFTSKCSVEIM